MRDAVITRAWIDMMARYNRWQNSGLSDTLHAMPEEEVRRDRGAFFGSIGATVNHILWGDLIWMHRLEGWDAPPAAGRAGTELCETLADWRQKRRITDARLVRWAETARTGGMATFDSQLLGPRAETSRDQCIAHMFNHQTHHRGQVHAMVTAAGYALPDTDLLIPPEDA